MIVRLKGVPADAMLIQACDRDYCGLRTMHGPIARLKWMFGDETCTTARPVGGCRGCGLPCRDVFELEPIPEEPHP